jgi:hypothetical protein
MWTEKRQRAVITTYSGRFWVNVLERRGPLRGSFATREAAIAVGRAHAADARTVHVIEDEAGEIVETKSYERLARRLPGGEFDIPDLESPQKNLSVLQA